MAIGNSPEVQTALKVLAKMKAERMYCQECKEHSNRPSYCSLHKIHVGRKNCCDNFIRR